MLPSGKQDNDLEKPWNAKNATDTKLFHFSQFAITGQALKNLENVLVGISVARKHVYDVFLKASFSFYFPLTSSHRMCLPSRYPDIFIAALLRDSVSVFRHHNLAIVVCELPKIGTVPD